jgi:hypothetical protein
MFGLPKLSEPANVRLAFQWNVLLERRRLNGDAPWGDEGAVYDAGSVPAVALAEVWFECLVVEYYRRSLSLRTEPEAFTGWLDGLRMRVSVEIGLVWKDVSKSRGAWYQLVCRPDVEKALAALVKGVTELACSNRLRQLEVECGFAPSATELLRQFDAARWPQPMRLGSDGEPAK